MRELTFSDKLMNTLCEIGPVRSSGGRRGAASAAPPLAFSLFLHMYISFSLSFARSLSLSLSLNPLAKQQTGTDHSDRACCPIKDIESLLLSTRARNAAGGRVRNLFARVGREEEKRAPHPPNRLQRLLEARCLVRLRSGFRVWGSGFRVQGSGFRVQGSGCPP